MPIETDPALAPPLRRWRSRPTPTAFHADAFAVLYEAHFGRLYGYLRYRLGDPTQAEDLTAEVFVRAWQKLPAHLSPERTLAWLFTTARHLLSDAGRGRVHAVPLEALAEERHPATASAEVQAVRAEDALLLRPYLAALADRERDIVGLRFVAGLRHREIARVLGISEGNVAKILHRTLGKLRMRMGEEDMDNA